MGVGEMHLGEKDTMPKAGGGGKRKMGKEKGVGCTYDGARKDLERVLRDGNGLLGWSSDIQGRWETRVRPGDKNLLFGLVLANRA